MKKPTALTIEVSAEQLAALRVLDDAGDAQSTLLELVGRVIDGVTRPGAWERAWLEQAFAMRRKSAWSRIPAHRGDSGRDGSGANARGAHR